MTSDVEMQNPAAAMLDYEEALQELERQGGAGTAATHHSAAAAAEQAAEPE
jgi:hypothetical protein